MKSASSPHRTCVNSYQHASDVRRHGEHLGQRGTGCSAANHCATAAGSSLLTCSDINNAISQQVGAAVVEPIGSNGGVVAYEIKLLFGKDEALHPSPPRNVAVRIA